MILKDWYKTWFNSPYYHKLYFERDEHEARQFISNLLAYLQPARDARVIDVGCGRGRHSRILAGKGLDVTGIDLSPANIAFASKWESDHLHFYQQDMRLPFWINYFDYAFNFFTSFGYFNTRREDNAAIRSIANGLCPSGCLIIDYLNVHYAENHLVASETKQIDHVTYEIRRWQDQGNFYKQIHIKDSELDVQTEFTEKVAKYALKDFTHMLSLQSLQVLKTFGNYNLDDYDVINSPRLVLIGQKTRR